MVTLLLKFWRRDFSLFALLGAAINNPVGAGVSREWTEEGILDWYQVNIKTKHLKPSKNKLKARFKWRSDRSYCVGRCSYTIKEISFKDCPPLLYNFAVSSIPAEAYIYLDGKYCGKTPKNLEVGLLWFRDCFRLESLFVGLMPLFSEE